MKLYTNLIHTKTMSVIVSLPKACLGQSWQAKSIFQVLVGDNIHIFAGWLGVWFICGVVISNISLSGTQTYRNHKYFQSMLLPGAFQPIPNIDRRVLKTALKTQPPMLLR